MQRITQRDLEARVEHLNNITGFKGKVRYNTVGGYILSYAYGGVELQRVVSDCGGIEDVLSSGHTTKKDLYNRINAYIAGMEV